MSLESVEQIMNASVMFVEFLLRAGVLLAVHKYVSVCSTRIVTHSVGKCTHMRAHGIGMVVLHR